MKIQRILLALSFFLFCLPLFADEVPEALRPPKGAKFAIVVFEDLQCPSCGLNSAAAGAGFANL